MLLIKLQNSSAAYRQDRDHLLQALGDDLPFCQVLATRLESLLDRFNGEVRLMTPRVRNLTREHADTCLQLVGLRSP